MFWLIFCCKKYENKLKKYKKKQWNSLRNGEKAKKMEILLRINIEVDISPDTRSLLPLVGSYLLIYWYIFALLSMRERNKLDE